MGTAPPMAKVDRHQIPMGQPPRVPYVDGGTVVLPNRRKIVLERPPKQSPEDISGESYGAVARVRAGWIGSTYDFMQDVTTFHAADGDFRRLVGGTGPSAVSADGRRVLLSGYLQTIVLTSTSTSVTTRVLDALPGAPRTSEDPVGFLGRRGERVVLNLAASSTSRSRGVMVTGDDQTYQVPGVARAAAVSSRARLISGTHHRGYRAKASTVYSLDGNPVFRAPGFELLSFSPDGSMAVGTPHKWNSRRLVVVSLRTGRVLLHVGLSGPVTWEDERHLLAVVTRFTRTRLSHGLLRLSLDGSMQWALPMRPTPIVAGRPLHGPHPVKQPG